MNQSAHLSNPESRLLPNSTLLGSKLRLPAFYYPFPEERDPNTDAVEAEVVEWAVRYALVGRGGKGEAMLRSLGPADVCGRMYHCRNREAFLAASIWSAWMFLVDEHFCETGAYHGSPGRLAQFHLWLRAILTDPGGYDWRSMCGEIVRGLPAEYAELCLRTGEATTDMAQRIEKVSSSMQYVRWMESMTCYFLSTIWQLGLDMSGPPPSVQEYLLGRASFSGAPPTCALADIVAGYEVPANEHQRVEVRRLQTLVGIVLGLCNDVMSFPREIGVIWNLPNILIAQGMSQQEAITNTVRIHNDVVREYLDLEARITPWAGAELRRFLHDMGTLMRGHYDWARQQKRYAATDNYFFDAPVEPDDFRAA
ncbi:terpene synthase family protein [Bradyrhizobium sp. ORS 111]|uniref:terpene synthase family protein n=1 Tax=Bradyrhizobium sp. ORS 111 TaxID=1685958 RepID=UPI00388DA94C